MQTPPWLSVDEAIVAARDLPKLLGDEVTSLLDVRVRPEHADIISTLMGILAGPDELVERVARAEEVLRVACVPGGVADPRDDRADVVWCVLLNHLGDDPSLGAAVARRWVRHLVHLQHEDHAVSVTMEGVAAYAVASFERSLGRVARYQRWMSVAANATDHEVDRPGLSLVVAVRAALLLDRQSGRPLPTRLRLQ